jgi:hypothetical protein
MSRDIPSKHHHEDAMVYRALAGEGVSLRVMGGTCVSDGVADLPGASFVVAGSRRTIDFLRELDCFYYRTSDHWLEAFGRGILSSARTGLRAGAELRHGVRSDAF